VNDATARNRFAGIAIPPERVVGRRMHIFSNTIQGSFYKRTEQPFGISLSEWRVLRGIIFEPGRSQVEVAAAEALNVMNVSRAVAGLRRKGLAEVETDPDDGRRSLLFPTGLAEDLALDMLERERVMYEHVYSCLDEAELRELDELLARVNRFVATTELPAPPEASRDWSAIFRDA